MCLYTCVHIYIVVLKYVYAFLFIYNRVFMYIIFYFNTQPSVVLTITKIPTCNQKVNISFRAIPLKCYRVQCIILISVQLTLTPVNLAASFMRFKYFLVSGNLANVASIIILPVVLGLHLSRFAFCPFAIWLEISFSLFKVFGRYSSWQNIG